MVQRHEQSSTSKTNIARVCTTIAQVPIESITPDPSNPRAHSREQVRAIARSIQTFGFNAPILVDNAGTAKAGHGRLEAAKVLKLTRVPVIRLEHLSEQQTKAYMLADNKLTDRSSWDDSKLALRLKELQDIVIDFEIEATGFEAPEIDFRIQSLEPPDAASADDEFEPPVEAGGVPAWRSVGSRTTSAVLRQCTRVSIVRGAPQNRTRRRGVYRPALQCADKRARSRQRAQGPS